MTDKKKKVTIGYKKLKNVDTFDQFDIHKEELQGGVNESNSMFASDVDNLFIHLNIISSLQDEGYMNDNGSLKSDVADAADYVAGELGINLQKPWQTEEDFNKWIQDVMDEIREFGSKY